MKYYEKIGYVMNKYKQRSENQKAWREKKQDKINQRKKGFKPPPFHNMSKGYQENNFSKNSPQIQGGNK
jgi:hypothetical protein